MVDRISPPIGPRGPGAAEVEGVAEVGAGGAIRPAEPAAADAVAGIAADVAAGRISRDEAVERIVAEALSSDLVRAAPADLRAELAAALDSLIATDPYLKSLVQGLGSARAGEGG